MAEKILNGDLSGTVTNGLPANWHWYGTGTDTPVNYYANKDSGTYTNWYGWYNPESGHPDGGGCLQIGGGGREITPSVNEIAGMGWIQEFNLDQNKVYTVTADIMVYTPTYRTNSVAIGCTTTDAGHNNPVHQNYIYTTTGLANLGWTTVPILHWIPTGNANEVIFRFWVSMYGSTESEAFVRIKNVSVLEDDPPAETRTHFSYTAAAGAYDVWSDYPDFDTKSDTTNPGGELSSLAFTIAKHERCLTQICIRPHTGAWTNAKITYDGLTGLTIDWRLGFMLDVSNPTAALAVTIGRTGKSVEPLVSMTDFPLDVDTTYPFFVDIYAPDTAINGDYTGNIYVKDGNTTKATIPITVTVRRFKLAKKNSERTFRTFLVMNPEDKLVLGRPCLYWNTYGGETVDETVMGKYWKEAFENYASADFGLLLPSNYDSGAGTIDITEANNPLIYWLGGFLATNGYDLPGSTHVLDPILDNGNFATSAGTSIARFSDTSGTPTAAYNAVGQYFYDKVHDILGGPWASYQLEEKDPQQATAQVAAERISQANLMREAVSGLQIVGTGKPGFGAGHTTNYMDYLYPASMDNIFFKDLVSSAGNIQGAYFNSWQAGKYAPRQALWLWQMFPLALWHNGMPGGVVWWNFVSWNDASYPWSDKNPWFDTTPYNVTLDNSTINLMYPPSQSTTGYGPYANSPTPSIRWRMYTIGVGHVMHIELLNKLISENRGTIAQRATAQAAIDNLGDIIKSGPWGENAATRNTFALRDYAAFNTWKDDIGDNIEVLLEAPRFYSDNVNVPNSLNVVLLDADYTFSMYNTLADLTANTVSGGGELTFTYSSKTLAIDNLEIDSGATAFKYIAIVGPSRPCFVYERPDELTGTFVLSFGNITTS